MPPKQSLSDPSSSAPSSSLPYPSPSSTRRPKSSRQQFSACGACRMRRVKCDLKDHYDNAIAAGIPPSCSNCRERSLKCVDEYADIKTVKLLRRGRRLQQVEAVYGNPSGALDLGSPSPISPSVTSPIRSSVPQLNPTFFQSNFYRRFHIQRPIVDPNEFATRYRAYYEGNDDLTSGCHLIAMLFVVWAASYGVDELGAEEPHGGPMAIQQRKIRCNEMVKEVLRYVDMHSILRKPTWDGVRGLLLLMPLTEEVQTPLDRLVMYESTISQVYTLCSLGSVASVSNPLGGEYDNALVRARIFWYAYINEGITTGLRGGRLYLDYDDLETFQRTLPPIGNDQSNSSSNFRYSFEYRLAMTPVRLSSACRQVHACLTGPRARQKNDIDEGLLRGAWDSLDICWTEFEDLQDIDLPEYMQREDLDRFIGGWQIFIFECYNIVREAVKQRITALETSRNSPTSPHNSPASIAVRDKINKLHTLAESKCVDGVRNVIALAQRHLNTPFFEYDASLARDGVFFASFLLAEGRGSDDDLNTCVEALRQYRWAFSKNDEREQTLRMVRDNTNIRASRFIQSHEIKREPSGSPPSSNASVSGRSYTPAQHPSTSSIIIPTLPVTSTTHRHARTNSSPMQVSRPSSHGSPVSAEGVPAFHRTAISSRSSTTSLETRISSAQGSRSPRRFGTDDNPNTLSIITTFPTSRLVYSADYEPQSQYQFPPAPASNPLPSGGDQLAAYSGSYYESNRGTYSAPPTSIPMEQQQHHHHHAQEQQPASASGPYPPYSSYNVDYYNL